MDETPKTELDRDHDAVLKDIGDLAQKAQAAPATETRTGNPITGECIRKAWERIDRYWAALTAPGKARKQLGWSKDQADKDKAELLRRLTGCREDARITARSIYQAAIGHLKEKPEPPPVHPVRPGWPKLKAGGRQ